MNIKLITCDWEGCISEPGGGIVPWPTDNIARLSRLINLLRSDARYPPFVLCSGRQIPYGEAALQAINAFWDYMPSILENGSALYFPKTKKVLWNPLITDSTQKAIIEIHRQLSVDIKQMDLTKEIGKEYCISLNPPVTMDIEFLYQSMIEQLKDYSELIEVTHSKSAVDITPKGVNKGSGVRFLSDVTGIELDDMDLNQAGKFVQD